jgi:predicted metal-dependent HD superfamily phosphohydrolase
MQIAGLTLPDAMIDALRSAYAAPPRAYHHFGHVEDVLIQHGEVASGPGWTQPLETALAVLYHDAVYVAGARDNEARSAVLARQHIAHWLPHGAADAGRVAELIELTARHGQFAPADFGAGGIADDTRHFLDCDMAILGAPSEAFDRYDSAIAEEYRGVVPAWLYRRKRRAFLRSLLERERIFLSDFFHARLDGAARANLTRAVAPKATVGARD